MLDIKFIRENPDAVKENIKKKFQEAKLPLVDQLLEREPLVRHNYLRYLAQRIHFLSGRIQSLAQPGAEVKLARYLLCEQQQGVVSLSAAELARRLSIGRATLYRAFQRLEEDGLIRREGKNVFLPNIPALQAYITQ